MSGASQGFCGNRIVLRSETRAALPGMVRNLRNLSQLLERFAEAVARHKSEI